MKTTRPAKTLAALHAMLDRALIERGIWARNGLDLAQKDAEVAGIREQIAKLEG
jgi:hypothetical protein